MSLKIKIPSFKIGHKTILSKIEIEVLPGQLVGLFGPNGAGKSTTFKLITGFHNCEELVVSLGNKNLSKYPIHKRILSGLAYLPQQSTLLWDLSVEDNLRVVSEFHPHLKVNFEKTVQESLDRFSLMELRKQMAGSLSGGEKRRLELARILLLKPKYILVDEPFAGIDPLTMQDLKKLFLTLSEEGHGILLTDHNVLLTLDICKRVYIINKGGIIFSGSPESVKTDLSVRDCFLGDSFREQL